MKTLTERSFNDPPSDEPSRSSLPPTPDLGEVVARLLPEDHPLASTIRAGTKRALTRRELDDLCLQLRYPHPHALDRLAEDKPELAQQCASTGLRNLKDNSPGAVPELEQHYERTAAASPDDLRRRAVLKARIRANPDDRRAVMKARLRALREERASKTGRSSTALRPTTVPTRTGASGGRANRPRTNTPVRGSRRSGSRAGPSSADDPPDESHSGLLTPLLAGGACGRVSAVQTALAIAGYALPVDPVVLARENCFEVRHQLRELDLTDEQIAVAEEAVELVRRGEYPPAPVERAA